MERNRSSYSKEGATVPGGLAASNSAGDQTSEVSGMEPCPDPRLDPRLDLGLDPGPEHEAWMSAQHANQVGLSPEGPPPHLFLQAKNLTKTYVTGGRALRLFDGLDFEVQEGELVAIVGQSGAGKSTLLHMLGALDIPTSGDVFCSSTSLTALTRKQASRFRNREVGYVWQFHYLLPEFTAAENVAMPLLASGARLKDALDGARVWLERVGLNERLDHRAGELSGGEQQRVAIARALVTEPRLLLADEPTGDLDSETAESVFALIESLHRSHKLTTVLATHNMALARRARRVLRLAKGRLEEVDPKTV